MILHKLWLWLFIDLGHHELCSSTKCFAFLQGTTHTLKSRLNEFYFVKHNRSEKYKAKYITIDYLIMGPNLMISNNTVIYVVHCVFKQ